MAVIISRRRRNSRCLPPGNHVAVCFGVAELGTAETEFGFKPKMRLFFELSTNSWTTANRSLISRRAASALDATNKANRADSSNSHSWRGPGSRRQTQGVRRGEAPRRAVHDQRRAPGIRRQVVRQHRHPPLAKGIPKPA